MKNMKVALISFHNAYNYGACLQAYALQEAVSEMNVECEYIDYVNKRRAEGYKMSHRIAKALKEKNIKSAVKNMCGAPFVWSRGSKFNKFYSKYLRKTDITYHSVEEAKILEQSYDKFVVGSDQVWNAEHNGTDSAYFLDFVSDNSKKISYSSSFGMADIPEELNNWYASLVKNIPCLSTREKHGVKIIKDLSGRHAHLVLDPVFLLDGGHWKKFVKNTVPKEKYTFYYMNAEFNIDDFARVTKWKDNKRYILSSSVKPKDFIKRGQKVTFAMSPEEFIEQINNAELVVTTSFHCLAFSIMLHKPFVAILSGDEGRDERLLNLLQITGLENRIFSDDMMLDDVNRDIDYSEVEKRLRPYRDYSKQFLYTSIYKGQTEADSIKEPPYPKSQNKEYTICQKDKCTGCGVCAVKCPSNAIEMLPDKEGFLQPVINSEKCIKCHLCQKVCQINDEPKAVEYQHYYAFKNDDVTRAASSSGGAFTALARKVIGMGGAVAASEMSKDWHAEHTVAETMDGVKKQAKTYYVQGSAFRSFSEIEKLLKDGRTVLFTGTPCQVQGLKKYLRKDYTNLILCDIICHGIPSPKMFDIYTDYLKSRGELTSLKQRDKTIGWAGYCVSAEIGGKKFRNNGWLKAYSVMFSHGLINRKSCYSCPYSNYNRVGDITIGDYWGIEKHRRELKDKLGVSLVITNTEKGDNFFKSASSDMRIWELEKNETAQNSLLKPKKKPLRRKGCIILMESSYEQAAKNYGEWNTKGYIKEFIRGFMLKLK